MSPDPKRVAADYASAIEACKNREEAASLYADALATYGTNGLDWHAVNTAILKRWSLRTGLPWIKARAWKIAREGAK